jgi:hypothetical protein
VINSSVFACINQQPTAKAQHPNHILFFIEFESQKLQFHTYKVLHLCSSNSKNPQAIEWVKNENGKDTSRTAFIRNVACARRIETLRRVKVKKEGSASSPQ